MKFANANPNLFKAFFHQLLLSSTIYIKYLKKKKKKQNLFGDEIEVVGAVYNN